MYSVSRWMLAGLLALLMLAAPALAQDTEIPLVPFESEAFGFQGLVPEEWRQPASGLYARGDGTDITMLALQSMPVSPDLLLRSLLPQLRLTEAPESIGELATDTLTWTLYRIDVELPGMEVVVDLALAQADGRTFLALLQAAADEYEALHESVFMPVIRALSPLGAAPVTTPADADEEEALPYLAEEVTFDNGDVTLAGTLTLPPGPGPHPALVLVTGSGPQDRDESIAIVPGYRPFRDIADYLTRRGIAVLRYDDRGFGSSTGDFAAATTGDFATDAAAAVDFLLARDDINPAQIGILGHSEGGAVAAIVAAEHAEVAFAVSLAGAGVSGRETSMFQNAVSLESSGITGDERDAILALVGEGFDLAAAGDFDAARQKFYEMSFVLAEALPEDQRALLGDVEIYAQQSAEQQTQALQSPWIQYYLQHNPADYWAQVSVPVLAIFGGLDLQVEPEQNAAALQAALDAAQNDDYTEVCCPEEEPRATYCYQPVPARRGLRGRVPI